MGNENSTNNEKDNGTNNIRGTYGIIRKSELFMYFLPTMYFIFFIVIIFYFLLSSSDFSNLLKDIKILINFLNDNISSILFIIIPIILLLVYTFGIIINGFAGKIFYIFNIYDQVFLKENFVNEEIKNKDNMTCKIICKVYFYFKKVINFILNFFCIKINKNMFKGSFKSIKEDIIKKYNEIFNLKEDKEIKNIYNNTVVYWNIFQYVMQNYYGKENIYDDLRKSLFIRNIFVSNLLIIAVYLIYSFYFNYINLLILFFLIILNLLYYYIYKSYIKFYHFKLLYTFNYMNTVKNVKDD